MATSSHYRHTHVVLGFLGFYCIFKLGEEITYVRVAFQLDAIDVASFNHSFLNSDLFASI